MHLIIFLMTFFSYTLQAQETQKNHAKNLTQHFLKTVELSCNEKPESIVYGSSNFSYFSRKKFYYKNKSLTFSFFPPFYGKKITFWGVKKGVKIRSCETEKIFQEPDTKKFLNFFKAKIRGNFSKSFYLLSALNYRTSNTSGIPIKYLKASEKTGDYLNIIINKWGQIVWAYKPKTKKDYSLIRKSKKRNDQFYILSKYHTLEKINSRGISLQKTLFSGSTSHTPHHEIIQTNNGNKIISFYDQEFKKEIPKNLLKDFKYPPPKNRTLRSRATLIAEYDLRTNKQRVLQTTSPLDPFDFSWHENKTKILKKVYAIIKHKVDYDYMHGNSISQDTDKNWIISYRNRSQIISYSQDFSKTNWTLNGQKKGEKTLKTDFNFYRQHSVQSLKTNRYVLFDNHPHPPAPENEGSSIKIFTVKNNKASLEKTLKDNNFCLSRYRGNVHQITKEKDHFIALFPLCNHKEDRILEFEGDSIKASMHIGFAPITSNNKIIGIKGGGYQVEATESIEDPKVVF